MPPGDGLGGLEAADIQAALDEVLAWEPMRRSPQLSAFLDYVVKAVMRGEPASIKAYSIAVDVFGRGEDFDPQTDPIVRVQARRLRILISSFYDAGLARSPARIVLPVGSYVPEFVRQLPGVETGPVQVGEAAQADPSGTGPRNVWIVGVIALGVLVSAVLFWPTLAERTGTLSQARQPVMPLVVVEEFENLASDELGTPLVAGLALELVTDFNRFSDVSARYGGAQAALSPAEAAAGQPVYLLSGVARRVPEGIQYGVLVTEGTAEAVVASVDVTVPLVNGQPSMSLDDISQFVVLRLAGPRGPLHRRARAWLAEETGAPLDLYPCLVAYGLYVERRTEADAERAGGCAERLAEDHADAAAILASIKAEEAWSMGADTAQGTTLLEEASALALAARDAGPTNGAVWAALGHVALMAGDLQAARDHYNAALQLNPAAIDVVATYAHVLAKVGNWPAALRLFEAALAAEPDPPGWYYLTPALHALRNGDYAQAVAYAERTADIFPDTSAAILVAAGGAMRSVEIVNAYLPRLLAGQRFRRLGILPALRYQISDPELLRQLSNGMSIAGVPLDRLARPF